MTAKGQTHEVQKETLSMQRVPKRQLAMWRAEVSPSELADAERLRPKTRGDCASVPRPCPFVSCRHNLYLDVNDRTGSITHHYPGLNPEDMPPERSCSLDIVDATDDMSLEDVAFVSNITRERVRQVLEIAGGHFRNAPGSELVEEYVEEGSVLATQAASEPSAFPSRRRYRVDKAVEQQLVEVEPDEVVEPEAEEARMWGVPPVAISTAIMTDGARFVQAATDTVWRIYLADSTMRGFEKPRGFHGKLAADLAALQPGSLTEAEMYVAGTRYVDPDVRVVAKKGRRRSKAVIHPAALDSGVSQPPAKETKMAAEMQMTERMQTILDYHQAHPDRSQQAIADALKIAQTTVSRDMRALRAMDKIGPPARGPGSEKKESPQAGQAAPAVRPAKKKKPRTTRTGGAAGVGAAQAPSDLHDSRNGMVIRKHTNGASRKGGLSDAVQALHDELAKLEAQATGIRTAIAVLESRL